MLISNKSKEIMDQCRFCWMCRHICPIGNATGQERNTARARMLGLSLVEREAEPLSVVAENIYECSLCEACTKECVTGWDPVKAVNEVKLELALNDETPSYINTLFDKLEATGNIFGATAICDALTEAVARHSSKTDTLFVIGKTATYKSCKNAKTAIELLEAANIDFTCVSDQSTTGADMMFLVGAAEDTKQVAKEFAKKLNEYATVVIYDPQDAKLILREYKEWGLDVNSTIKTFTSFVSELIESKKLNVKKGDGVYTPQDAHFLARSLEETEPIRKILNACGNVCEMLLNCKDTMLAGNLTMNEYMPDVMLQVARDRWTNAVNMNAKTVVTESPDEYELLSATKPDGMELKSIEEVVLSCL